MKKLAAILCVIALSIFVMPVFVACNGSGSTQAVGVKFKQSSYAVEYNVPTKLDFQIFPTTATNNNVSIIFSTEPGAYFDYLADSYEFVLKSRALTDVITATISVNNTFTDTCTIYQKIYPSKITFNDESYSAKSDVINKGAAYPLRLWAKFGDEKQEISTDKFDIEYVSDDPSVVYIEGDNAVSTGKNGVVKISAYIKNSSGDYAVEDPDSINPKRLKAELELTVVDNASEAIVSLEQFADFISVSKNAYERTDNNSYVVSAYCSQVRCAVNLYSADGHQLDTDQIEISMISANKNVATVTKQTDNLFLISLSDITFASGETPRVVYARIEISSSATDAAGNPVKFVFYIAKALS